jgi:excisionase family DNA binding protein
MAADDSLVTIEQAAELLSVSVRTVYRMQADGDLQPVYIYGARKRRLRRYRLVDVLQLQKRIRTAAATDAGPDPERVA